MSSEVSRFCQFDFRGDPLHLLADDSGRYVGFASACKALGVRSSEEAWADLSRRDSLRMYTRVDYGPNGELVRFLRVEAFPQWIAFLPSDSISPSFRAKHAAWTCEIVRAVYDFTTKGVAVNERVVGADARRQIEAIAEQARASRLAECRQFYEIARRDMPGDAILMARAEQMVRQIISREAGASAARGADEPDTVAGVLGSVGCDWPDADVNRFGGLVAGEYRRRYKKDPPRTNQFGRRSEPGSHSGRSIYPRCYPPADWPWILGMARQYARDNRLPAPAAAS